MIVDDVILTSEATTRINFSVPHLKAAQHFADRLRCHEQDNAKAEWGPHFEFCRWYATAAIILSFSAIEAAVDEAEDDLKLPRELEKALERRPTLDHAQELLAYKETPVFDKGKALFQSVELLCDLRNGLVHPKAEWYGERDRSKKLALRIVSANLPLSPFQPDEALAFPHGCMSAGVASWAESSARRFIRELRSRLELGPTV